MHVSDSKLCEVYINISILQIRKLRPRKLNHLSKVVGLSLLFDQHGCHIIHFVGSQSGNPALRSENSTHFENSKYIPYELPQSARQCDLDVLCVEHSPLAVTGDVLAGPVQ